MLKLWDIKPSRKHKRPADLKLVRVHELGRVARDRGGACDAILNAVARALLYVESKDVGNPDRLSGMLARWAYRYAPATTKGRLAAAVDAVTDYPHWQSAPACARAIGLTEADRLRLKITQIDACNATKQQLAQSAKQRKRDRDKIRAKAKRRAGGRPTREQIAAQAAERRRAVAENDVSQATLYRHRKARENAASPLLLRENAASPFPPAIDDNATSPHVLTSLGRRPTIRCVENVAGSAGAAEAGNSTAQIRQSEPPAFGCQGKSGADAEQIAQPPVAAATLNPDSGPTATERLEQFGQLSWLEPARPSFVGQPDGAARIGGDRARASVPARGGEAGKHMFLLQRWGVASEEAHALVTLWHERIAADVIADAFAGAIHRRRGPRDAMDWILPVMKQALRDPYFIVPTRDQRSKSVGAIRATFEKAASDVLTVAGVHRLLEIKMPRGSVGVTMRIMAETGQLICVGKGRYRRPPKEEQDNGASFTEARSHD